MDAPTGAPRPPRKAIPRRPGGLALLLALSLLPSCAPRPLEIGFLGGLTGRLSALAVAGRNGALLRLEEENARGGIRGRRLVLVAEDDRNEAASLALAIGRLEARGIRLVIGPFTSAMGVLAAERRDGPLFLSPTVSANAVAGKDDRFVRFMTSGSETTLRTARAARGRFGLKRVRAIYDLANLAYAGEYIREFREEFERLGGDFLEPVAFDSGAPGPLPYDELAAELAREDPEGVLLVAGAGDAALIARRLSALGGERLLLASGWSVTTDLIGTGGAVAEGIVFAQQYDPAGTGERYLAFEAAYRARFGEPPSFSAALGYEAAGAAIRALAQGGRSDPESLKRRIIAAPVEGLQVDYVLDPYGDPEKETWLFEVRQGAYRRLE